MPSHASQLQRAVVTATTTASPTHPARPPLLRRAITLFLLSLTALTSCRDTTAPAATSDPAFANPAGTHVATAVAIAGPGVGGVSVSPKAVSGGYFDADIKVRLRHAMPSTTYIIQRAPEIGRASLSSGVCERALGLPPWSSADTPAPGFVTFVPPGQTAPVTLTTNASGDGAADFEFVATMIPTGTKFDVMFRLIDNASAPVGVVLSQCFTVTVL